MNADTRTEGVVSAGATLGMIDFIHSQGGEVLAETLVENVAVLFGASRAKLQNTIRLLADLAVVELRDGTVSTAEPLAAPDRLGKRLVAHIVEKHLSPGFADALLLSEKTDDVWVDAKRAPGRHLGVATLLVELGVFHRDRLTSPSWRIGEEYADQFIHAAARHNDALELGVFTTDDLQRKLEASLEAGAAAEEWVVTFEKARLKGHPFCGQVRRISEQQADAGFDVVSFRDRSAVAHNWLIEVKSFVGEPRFYWTANEVACAEREGERYVLYLVDRAKMQLEDYEPRVISGPFEFFFGGNSTPDSWTVTSSEYRVAEQG